MDDAALPVQHNIHRRMIAMDCNHVDRHVVYGLGDGAKAETTVGALWHSPEQVLDASG